MIEIANAALLSDLFGHWPDFHDAEILGFRINVRDHRDPILEIDFEVAEMSSELDERGYYRDRQRARTTISFARVANLRVHGIYLQNVIFDLYLEPAAPTDHDEMLGPDHARSPRRHHVWWTKSVGMVADFLCDDITVRRAASVVRAS
jgi:hypothetical protein